MMMYQSRIGSEAGPRAHTVQFYGEDISLLKETELLHRRRPDGW